MIGRLSPALGEREREIRLAVELHVTGVSILHIRYKSLHYS